MAQKISQMTEQTTASMTEAGTSDFLGGYTATGGDANRKFSLSGLANYFLNKFKMTLGGSSQTVKSAIDTLNSKITNASIISDAFGEDSIKDGVYIYTFGPPTTNKPINGYGVILYINMVQSSNRWCNAIAFSTQNSGVFYSNKTNQTDWISWKQITMT